MRKFTLSCLITILLLAACNKSNRYASKIEGNKWKIETVTLDGTNQPIVSTLLFKDCDIYEESCSGSWINEAEGRASFAWQFRDKGQTLEIINQTDHAHNLVDVQAAETCISFSGVYQVEKCTRNEIIISSTSTHGYPAKKINIQLSKIK